MRFLQVFISLIASISINSFAFGAADLMEHSQTIGYVTANFGDASISRNGASRTVDLRSPVRNHDRIDTNDGGLTVLLSSRAVIKIDAASAVRISDGSGGTTLFLEKGTIQVYVGERPATVGPIALQAAELYAQAADAVFLANYDPLAGKSYAACEHGSLDVQVNGSALTITLTPETQLVLEQGRPMASVLDRIEFDERRICFQRLGQRAVEQHSGVFRLRSRALDVETALSQLRAAGWLDGQGLSADPALETLTGKDKESKDGGGKGPPLAQIDSGGPDTARDRDRDDEHKKGAKHGSDELLAAITAGAQTPSVVQSSESAESPTDTAPLADAVEIQPLPEVTIAEPALPSPEEVVPDVIQQFEDDRSGSNSGYGRGHEHPGHDKEKHGGEAE